ncbi:hypothetical protein HQ587_10660 [bacterium]|nr:hypothetical protein [bacterium]
MYNGGKIIIGLLIFLLAMTFPIWYNVFAGKDSFEPELEIPTKNISGKDQCVLPIEEMRASHMDVLNEWRDTVVRKGERTHVTPDGREFNRSLSFLPGEPVIVEPAVVQLALPDTNVTVDSMEVHLQSHTADAGMTTEVVASHEAEIIRHSCLDCHSNKSNFCDKCHNYVAVDPYCWECHIIPEE